MDTGNVNTPGGLAILAELGFDTEDTLQREEGTDLAGGLNPVGASTEVAGVAPDDLYEIYGTESVQGKDETGEDFFRHLLESNHPVAGISATNKDWRGTPQPPE